MVVALFLDILFGSSMCFCDANNVQTVCDRCEVRVLDFGIIMCCFVGVNINNTAFEAKSVEHVVAAVVEKVVMIAKGDVVTKNICVVSNVTKCIGTCVCCAMN